MRNITNLFLFYTLPLASRTLMPEWAGVRSAVVGDCDFFRTRNYTCCCGFSFCESSPQDSRVSVIGGSRGRCAPRPSLRGFSATVAYAPAPSFCMVIFLLLFCLVAMILSVYDEGCHCFWKTFCAPEPNIFNHLTDINLLTEV